MTELNPSIVKSVDALSLVGGMAAKPIVEKLMSPVVGNGTFLSGIAKIGIAVAANKFLPGKIGNIVAIGAGADGAEDLIMGISGMKQTPTGGSKVEF